MKIPSIVYHVGLFVVAVFIAATIFTQLTAEGTPADKVCASALAKGADSCEVGKVSYEARVIAVNESGSTSAYLVVTNGKTVIAVIPIN